MGKILAVVGKRKGAIGKRIFPSPTVPPVSIDKWLSMNDCGKRDLQPAEKNLDTQGCYVTNISL